MCFPNNVLIFALRRNETYLSREKLVMKGQSYIPATNLFLLVEYFALVYFVMSYESSVADTRAKFSVENDRSR